MKFLIVFRGGYDRITDPGFLCRNVIKQIIEPLTQDGHTVETIFFTYNTDPAKLKIYSDNLHPKNISFTSSGQIINFKEALHGLKPIYSEYDYILFFRFELIYKMNIMEWNLFDKEGVILPYKEACYERGTPGELYGDNIIIFTKKYFMQIVDLMLNPTWPYFGNGINATLHNIGTHIKNNHPDIPLHCIVDGYYQSFSRLPPGDIRLNPLYIQMHYAIGYNGTDADLWLTGAVL
jgi:hypothetical protein